MQYCTTRSMALALTQAALGPSERRAAVCWLLSAKWGQFALGDTPSISRDSQVGVHREQD